MILQYILYLILTLLQFVFLIKQAMLMVKQSLCLLNGQIVRILVFRIKNILIWVMVLIIKICLYIFQK